jgi:hypothetical protein
MGPRLVSRGNLEAGGSLCPRRRASMGPRLAARERRTGSPPPTASRQPSGPVDRGQRTIAWVAKERGECERPRSASVPAGTNVPRSPGVACSPVSDPCVLRVSTATEGREATHSRLVTWRCRKSPRVAAPPRPRRKRHGQGGDHRPNGGSDLAFRGGESVITNCQRATTLGYWPSAANRPNPQCLPAPMASGPGSASRKRSPACHAGRCWR